MKQEWEWKKLGDEKYFIIIGSGIKKFQNSKDYLSTSSIDYNVIKQVEETITFKNRPSRANMQPVLNSVWFARMKDTIKVYSFTKNNQEEINKYILSTGFAGIKCLKEIDPDYLKFYFLSDNFNKQKNKLCSGSTQKAINNSSIKKISVPLPPLPVQKRIVSILEKAERLKERRKKANDETNKIIQSVFYEMFGKGDDFKNVELGDKKICEKIFAGGDVPKNNFSKEKTNQYKIPIFTNGEKNKGLYGYTDNAKVTKSSITISARGTIGYTEIRNENFYPAIRLIVIIPNEDFLNLYYLKSVIDNLINFNLSGTSIHQLTVPMIKRYKIPLPPLQLQLKFASVVKKIESMKERQKKSTEDINQLFDALMSKAFKGEL